VARHIFGGEESQLTERDFVLASSRIDRTFPQFAKLLVRFVVGVALVALALLAFMAAAASAAISPELKRYPYLTDTVGDSATVNWGTTRLSNQGVLKYGKVGAEDCTAHTVATTRIAITVGTTPEFQWKAQLTGLEPNTSYCYRIYMTASSIDLLGDDPSPVFKSQVAQGSSDPFSFAVFGDWGYVHPDGTNPDQANVMSQIAQSGVNFALTTGDNAYTSGSQINYGDLTQTGDDTSAVFGQGFWGVPGRSIPLYPTMGNHGFSGATTALNNWPQEKAVASSNGKYTKETYCCLNGTTSGDYPSMWYAFDAGNARFYVLEAAWTSTNPGTSTQYGNDYAYHWTTSSEEYKWLQKDLATHSRSYKFAFFHYPLYSDNYSENTDFFLHGQDGLEGLLNRYGVDFAFTGHAHLYQRNVANPPYGLPNYTTGGGGAFPEPIANGSANCGQFDAYGIGWSESASLGSACGAAPVPAAYSQVFHFIKVSVSDNGLQITPTDSLGNTFDVQTIQHTTRNSDLSISTTDSPDPVLSGDTLTYNLTVQNNGPDDAPAATVTDTLPSGVDFVSATASNGACSQASGIATCKLGAIANGASATVAVKVKPTSSGSITNNATVVGDDLKDATSFNDSTDESTTVQDGADLAITQTDSADPVEIGNTVTYTLAVRNNGILDATGVNVTDNLPAGLTYQSATPSQGSCSEAGGAISCALGSLANGADATIDVAATADTPGTVSNTAGVQADQPDGNTQNNSATESTTIKGDADLAITNSDSPDPVGAGQTLTYTLGVTNNGPNSAPSVTVTDNLPSGVNYRSATPSQGSCSQASGTVTCDLGAIDSSGSATVTITIVPPVAGTISNTATVAGSQSIDKNSANDSATATTTVKGVTNLTITNVDGPDPVDVGKQITYTIRARNNGTLNATGVTVTDTLPASVSYVSATTSRGTCFQSVPGTVTCTVGALAVGQNADIKIIVTANASGTITDTASVQSDQIDSNPADNSATTTTTVRGVADLGVTMTGSPSPAFVGNTLTYVVTVKNNGPSLATGVTAVDNFPNKQLSYQSATASQGSCSLANNGKKVTCSLGSLASGSTATITLSFRAIKDGKATNQVSVSGNENDPVGNNDSASLNIDIKK
jgi:uncharacterized repeat protein (TIGR01451 family)